ncbi:MAG: hypothetical protein F6K48_02900 [Okeania sp. SIO3H1]|nr:hypothetical protein [Okeania sp. SIO3H1]
MKLFYSCISATNGVWQPIDTESLSVAMQVAATQCRMDNEPLRVAQQLENKKYDVLAQRFDGEWKLITDIDRKLNGVHQEELPFSWAYN